MTYLIANLWLCFLLAGLTGLGIGWWIWGGASRDARTEPDTDEGVSAPFIPPAPPEGAPESEIAPAAQPEPVVATAAEPDPEPVAAPSPFMDAPDGEPDNLTLIKGVGPKLGDMLHALGVFHFAQIAGWDADQVAEVDTHLGNFRGRIERDRWIEQARLLAARNVAAFEREFGKMNGPL